jgi:TPR repeat protein
MKQDLLLLNTKAANGDKASISTLATYYLLGRGTPKNVDRALDIISRPEMSEAAIAYTLKVAIYTGAFGNEYFDLKQARAAALSRAALGSRSLF